MKHLQLATIGALYSVTIVLLLTVLGVVRFGESPHAPEVLGLLMAVGALILLSRFG
jgi:small multidrug resistance pump